METLALSLWLEDLLAEREESLLSIWTPFFKAQAALGYDWGEAWGYKQLITIQ